MLGLIQWIKNFTAKIQRDNIGAYAAQSAYFVILSFFPFVMFLLTLLNFIPIDANTLIDELVGFFPESAAVIVTPIVNEILSKSSGTLMSITILILLWTAGKGLMALTNGLNAIHEIKETRNYIVLRMISTIYTLLFALMIILVLIVLVFGNQLYLWVIEKLPFLGDIAAFVISIRTFASLMILTTVFLLFYKMLPAVKVRLWHQLPGAVFSACGWLLFSYGFSIYVDFSKNISYMYGSLAGIILLMLWLYFCMNIIFIGAEINYILYPDTKPDTSGLKY